MTAELIIASIIRFTTIPVGVRKCFSVVPHEVEHGGEVVQANPPINPLSQTVHEAVLCLAADAHEPAAAVGQAVRPGLLPSGQRRHEEVAAVRTHEIAVSSWATR